MLFDGYAGKWKGVTVAVKIVEHSSEANGGIRQLRESILSSSIIHPNVVRHSLHCHTCASHCVPSQALRYREALLLT